MSLLTVQQLATATEESVSVWRKRIRNREIPFVRCGRNVRVRRADFEAWIDARVESTPAGRATSSNCARGIS